VETFEAESRSGERFAASPVGRDLETELATRKAEHDDSSVFFTGCRTRNIDAGQACVFLAS
jgi:hypothetical protein